MADYIDREAALEALNGEIGIARRLGEKREQAVVDGVKAYIDGVTDSIRAIPSADVAPVRHGRWDTEMLTDACGCKHAYYACSVCGISQNWDEFEYCPFCGARMDGDTND